MSLRALSSLASVLRFKMIVLLIKTIVKVINTKSSMANTVFIVFSFLIGCRVRGAGVAPALEYRRSWQALAGKMTAKNQFSHPMCSTEVVNLASRLQGGWNRIYTAPAVTSALGATPLLVPSPPTAAATLRGT